MLQKIRTRETNPVLPQRVERAPVGRPLISETEIYECTDMQIEICGPPPIKRRRAPRGTVCPNVEG